MTFRGDGNQLFLLASYPLVNELRTYRINGWIVAGLNQAERTAHLWEAFFQVGNQLTKLIQTANRYVAIVDVSMLGLPETKRHDTIQGRDPADDGVGTMQCRYEYHSPIAESQRGTNGGYSHQSVRLLSSQAKRQCTTR